jgi:N-methylhydantoinase B
VIENNYPVMISSYGLIKDSGGPGRSRGGMGINRKLKILCREAKLTIGSDREKTKPWGLCGGKSGRPFSIKITKKEGSERYLGTKTTTSIREGDVVDISTPGGGGWGDPLERSIEKIARDVDGGLVTTSSAEKDYGVVFKKDKKTIDIKETERSRNKKGLKKTGPK